MVSVFFNAITQNVLGTYESSRNGITFDLHAGKVPRSEVFNRTNQPKNSELTFSEWSMYMGEDGDQQALTFSRPKLFYRCIHVGCNL
jgi:hypothetical protein